MSILQNPQYDEGRASDLKEITTKPKKTKKTKKIKKLKGGRKRKTKKATNKLPQSFQQRIHEHGVEKNLEPIFEKLAILCTTRKYSVFKKQIKELHTTIHNFREQKNMTPQKLQNFLETKPIIELLKILIANGYGRQ